MNNIILDTNAFVYLIDYELGKSDDSITLEKKRIDQKKVHDLCTSARSLYVTSQSLYELFWQSVEMGDVSQFAIQYDQIAKMRKKYGIGFSVLNSVNCKFDLDKFATEFESDCIDIKAWVEQKRVYEKRILQFIIFTVFGAPLATVLTYLEININPSFFDDIDDNIAGILDKFSEKYYDYAASERPTNKDYDSIIDKLLLGSWEGTFETINRVLSDSGLKTIYIPENMDSSADYITMLLKKNMQRRFPKIYDVFERDLENYMQDMKRIHGMNDVSVLFLMRLITRCAREKIKVRKNDGIDYSIVSCLDVDYIKNETKSDFDRDETFLLTFDNNLYQFTKETNLMYKKAIYDALE